MAIYILKNKEKQGRYDESVVAGWLMNGTCALQDLAWRAGMKEWQPLSAIDLQAKSQFDSSGGILIAIVGGVSSRFQSWFLDQPRHIVGLPSRSNHEHLL